MKTKITSIRGALMVLLFNLLPLSLLAQGTAFTYQGSLNDGAGKASGVYDLQFSIYDDATAGNLIAGPLTNAATAVSNGLFTATLDFGAGVFTGPPRFLDISVRTNGAASFSPLTPRQPLTPTPYAITASNLSGTLPATQLSGSLSSNQLSGNYNNAVNFTNTGNNFAGNGSGLTGVNASTLGGLAPAGFWQTTGNSNIVAGLNYLGTADSNPLDFRVQNFRALRIQPDGRPGDVPNIIGGDYFNDVQQPGSGGNAIVGGGFDGGGNLIQTNSSGNFIGAGSQNVIGPGVFDSFIGGGRINSNLTSDSVIVGGWQNVIQTNSPYSFIGGGLYNVLGPNAYYSVIGGGLSNTNPMSYAAILGGANNMITTNLVGFYQPYFSAIGGGQYNIMNGAWAFLGAGYANSNNAFSAFVGAGSGNSANADYSAIVGGSANEAGATAAFVGGGGHDDFVSLGNQADGQASAVVGGMGNIINPQAEAAFIGGGYQNLIATNAAEAVISGGYTNYIGFASYSSFIGGGYQNSIGNTNYDAVISGGGVNVISNGSYECTIAGGYQNSIGSTNFDKH